MTSICQGKISAVKIYFSDKLDRIADSIILIIMYKIKFLKLDFTFNNHCYHPPTPPEKKSKIHMIFLRYFSSDITKVSPKSKVEKIPILTGK